MPGRDRVERLCQRDRDRDGRRRRIRSRDRYSPEYRRRQRILHKHSSGERGRGRDAWRLDLSRTRDLHRPQRRSWSRDFYKPPHSRCRSRDLYRSPQKRMRKSCDHRRERLRDQVFGLPELADLIFSYLDPDSIKAAARVSR